MQMVDFNMVKNTIIKYVIHNAREINMKVFISADIEGITDVTHWDETELDKGEFYAAREQMTAEVVAACEGALEVGASEIWVKDSHDSGRNILAPKLPREVRFIREWSGHPYVTLQELDETFQAILLIGYHSHAGTNTSPLAHSYSGNIHQMFLNDLLVSEFLIDGYTGAMLNVPVVFLSGDKGICQEAQRFNPNIQTVAVKEGVGGSTINIHPGAAVELIKAGVTKALQSDLGRCRVPLPKHFKLDVEFRHHTRAYKFGFYPGVKQTGPRTVVLETGEYFDLLRFLLFAM